MQSDVCESGSSWKQVQCVQNQLERARLHLSIRQQSLREPSTEIGSYVLDEKPNVLIWGLFVSTAMKASVHLVAELQGKFGGVQKHQLTVI